MSQELQIKGFYQDLRDTNWIDSNTVCALAVEFFLSQLLFKSDLSRVIYSKEDICFRRRLELVGNGDLQNQTFDYTRLDLPFAIYSQIGSYEPDDRSASMNAAAAVKGHIQPDTGIILKHLPVKIKYSATAFYARRDDVNIASQALYWETYPKSPIYFMVNFQLAGQPLDIPAFITLETVDSNVDYLEKKWLTDSKIFPIKIELTIRSYQTLIETLDGGKQMLPLRWAGLYGYNNERIYLTQNSILMWADDKWSKTELNEAIKKNPSYLEDPGPAIYPGIDGIKPLANDGHLYNLETKDDFQNTIYKKSILISECDQEIERLRALHAPEDEIVLILKEKNQYESDLNDDLKQRDETYTVSKIVESAVKGYFQPDPVASLVEYHIDLDRSTENSLMVIWRVNEGLIQNFKRIVIYVPGVCHHEETSAFVTEFEILGLHPGSEYDISLILDDLTGETLYRLHGRTHGEQVLNGRLTSNLIGRTFTGRN
jgi:hypothetical protein